MLLPLSWLTQAAAGDQGASDGLKIAIVGALALVLSTAIPVLVSTREKVRERQSAREPDYRSLLSDAVRQRDALQRKLDELRLTYADHVTKTNADIDRLERILWRLGYDPATGRRSTGRKHEADDPL